MNTIPNEKQITIFELKKNKHKLIEKPLHKYTTTEVDRLILGHLDDLGVFEKKGIIDIDTVYEEFSEYIENIWKNPAIATYIQWLLNDREY